MALDHLLDALTREAEVTAERLRVDARREAATLDALSVEVTGRRRQSEVEQVVRRRRDEVEHAVALARHEARDEVLRARARLLARVERALRAACPAALGSPRYRADLSRRVEGALACFPAGEVVSARAATALVEPILATWPAGRKVEVRADEGLGSGFVFTSADGTIDIEDTLEARFEALRPELERRALHLLGVEG